MKNETKTEKTMKPKTNRNWSRIEKIQTDVIRHCWTSRNDQSPILASIARNNVKLAVILLRGIRRQAQAIANN